MTEYPQGISESWSERRRLIRFRRKRERLRFWQEFKVVPRWLVGTVAALYLIALTIVLAINLNPAWNSHIEFPPEIKDSPALSSLVIIGIVTGLSLFFATFILLVGYVNRDAKRRGMNSGLWTCLVIILCPAYFAIGFVVYFLMRQPLPYDCPQCGRTVGAQYNFCPNCKCNLHPSCPQCKHEVVEGDKFCPYCAQDLRVAPSASVVVAPEVS